ncbi:SH3 domain-containing protein [Streptomyces sp. NPDC091266]|uniref:SH3 domain-containing protein n=1 Tax=Streptomyces sp. NPDC091266 TaxID=3365978 RepID=UPI003821F481
MRSTRIAVSTVMLGALALPMASTVATAAETPAPSDTPNIAPCDRPAPWVIGAKAVTIRATASSNSSAIGTLYLGHKFTVHKTTKNASWVSITDKTTGVTGWVSDTYVYRDAYTCRD